MITKQALDSAIAECQGDPNPNAQTCAKLASYFTIYDHMYEGMVQQPLQPQYSMDSGVVNYKSDSEFSKAVDGQNQQAVFAIIDDLMDAVHVLNPKLYKAALRKIKAVE